MNNKSKVFKKLEHFITQEMRMSHIYQPVMIMEVLRNSGKANVRQVAKALMMHDESQVEYYEMITKNMVGRVLTKNHEIFVKEKDEYRLERFEELTLEEAKAIINLCQAKLLNYIERRGEKIWRHRKDGVSLCPRDGQIRGA